jgi:hypothetical protein
MTQALHLLNGDLVERKVRDPGGRAARVLKEELKDPELVRELYLATFCRRPSAEEAEWAAGSVAQAGSRKDGVEDLLWSLLNSSEFIFQH